MVLAILLVAGRPTAAAGDCDRSSPRRSGSLRSGSSRIDARASSASSIPWSDAQGSGFQIVQAIIGIGSGGFTGVGSRRGPAEGPLSPRGAHGHDLRGGGGGARAHRLRARHRCVRRLRYAGFRVALRCRDPFGKLLAAGLTALVCGQAAINLAAVLGIAPLTGIPLPFVSYGGSSLDRSPRRGRHSP